MGIGNVDPFVTGRAILALSSLLLLSCDVSTKTEGVKNADNVNASLQENINVIPKNTNIIPKHPLQHCRAIAFGF